jgi:hypothetical protein
MKVGAKAEARAAAQADCDALLQAAEQAPK